MKKSVESIMWGKSLDYDYLELIKDTAVRLGLKGITFFRNDGSLKVIAEGEERNLLFFVKQLKHFQDISLIWHEPRNEFEDFSIC